MFLLVVFILFLVLFMSKEGFTGYSSNWKPSPNSKPADYPTAGEPWFLNQYTSPQNYNPGLPNVKYE